MRHGPLPVRSCRAPQQLGHVLGDDGIAARTREGGTGQHPVSLRLLQTPGQKQFACPVGREVAGRDRAAENVREHGGLSGGIDRVRHVLTHAADAPWAELAAATGYYDQSHMTADFRTLMGVPPRAYFTGRLPRATPCQGPASR